MAEIKSWAVKHREVETVELTHENVVSISDSVSYCDQVSTRFKELNTELPKGERLGRYSIQWLDNLLVKLREVTNAAPPRA